MQGTLSISKLKKLFTLSVTLNYCKVGKTTKAPLEVILRVAELIESALCNKFNEVHNMITY